MCKSAGVSETCENWMNIQLKEAYLSVVITVDVTEYINWLNNQPKALSNYFTILGDTSSCVLFILYLKDIHLINMESINNI